MQIRKVLALRGPNIWANSPVLEAWVDLEELKDSPSDTLPGFNERLMTWLPSLVEHECSIGERGGFFERLRRGTWMAHILEHVTLELQALAGSPSNYGRARETSEEGVYRVAIKYQEELLARECLKVGLELCLAAVYDRPFDVDAEIARLRELYQDVCLGPSTRAIADAAKARGIPMRRLNEGSLLQFGYGARQRRIRASETDLTGAIAESIAQDKELTRTLLAAVGVPVPEGRPVSSAEDAWEAAEEIGVPVVVKPQDGNQGRGVATNLTTREQVLAAYAAAREEGSSVLVEKFIPGNDYRLLVVGRQLVAAARRDPAQVTGDGIHTIHELVDRENLDPRRGEHHATVLSKIKLDDIALAVLAEQGFTPDSVPPAGKVVLIRRNANLSTGGTAVDVTDRVHPEWAARAVEAARMVGLDVAGIDVVAVDISQPVQPGSGAIVEVNAAPGLRMHTAPSHGTPRPVGEAIVNMLFPPGENGRIPIVTVTGVNGKTTTTRFIAHILKGTGQTVGMTCTDGIFIDDRRIDTGDCSGPKSARNVLMNPTVEMAVFETARGGILREGLGFDRCDVAVVTNIGEGDHLGLSDVQDLETLAKVKRCIVDVVPSHGTAVLNAADPYVAGMAEKCKGSVLFFAQSGEHPVIVEHRAKGGRAIFVRDQTVILAHGAQEQPFVPLSRIPLTHGGRVPFQIENALCAIAAAWSLGLPLDLIASRVDAFSANIEAVPGRFNVLKVRGTTVILDYGHNASALVALKEAIAHFPQPKRCAVYSTAGDRRDCDMLRQGQLLGEMFDRVILYEDHYLRGRPSGEIMRLFREGMANASRTKEVREVHGALKAVEVALKDMRPDELLVIQPDVVDETVDYVRQYLDALAAEDSEEALRRERERLESVMAGGQS